jgi:hypothetical protein
MTAIEDFVSGEQTGGSVKGAVTKVSNRQAGQYNITDVTLDDGTGTIILSLFDIEEEIEVGNTLYASQVYVKEFKGNNQLSVKKASEIKITQGGSSSKSSPKKDDKKPSGKTGNTQTKTKNEGKADDGWAKAAAQITMALDDIKNQLVEVIVDLKVVVLEQLKIMSGVKVEKAESGDKEQASNESDDQVNEEDIPDEEK